MHPLRIASRGLVMGQFSRHRGPGHLPEAVICPAKDQSTARHMRRCYRFAMDGAGRN